MSKYELAFSLLGLVPPPLVLGHHTLGIECKDVLTTGEDRMLVGNRVGVGLTRSTISSFALVYISHHGSEKKLSSW